MDIKDAHFSLNGRTKSERLAIPHYTQCELRVSIGQFGFAEIAIWQKAGKGAQKGDFGLLADITIHNPADMKRLGAALLKLADAAEAIEIYNPQNP